MSGDKDIIDDAFTNGLPDDMKEELSEKQKEDLQKLTSNLNAAAASVEEKIKSAFGGFNKSLNDALARIKDDLKDLENAETKKEADAKKEELKQHTGELATFLEQHNAMFNNLGTNLGKTVRSALKIPSA